MKNLFILAALFAVFASIGQAQTTTGEILGSVHDESGAVIAGSKIVARNLETNLSRETTHRIKVHFESRFFLQETTS